MSCPASLRVSASTFLIVVLLLAGVSGAGPAAGVTGSGRAGVSSGAVPDASARAKLVVPGGQRIQPGGSLSVTGVGFPASRAVAVSIDSTPATPRTEVTTTTAGGFHATFFVPAKTHPGAHQVTAQTVRGPRVMAQASVAVHTNWPMAYGNAHATNSSLTENLFGPASAADLAVAWSVNDPWLRSSVVVDGVVYVTEDDQSDPTHDTGSLFAIDAATGEVLWRNVDAGQAIAAPLVIGSEVWEQTITGDIYIYDAATGALKSVIFTGAEATCTGCLVLLEGTVYVLGRDSTLAVDVTTHEVTDHRAPYGASYYGAPFANGKAFFGLHGVFAYDLNSGKLAWSAPGPTPTSGVVGRAIAANGLVYVSWGTGEAAAYRQSDGALVWITPTKKAYAAGFMTVQGDTVYVTSGSRTDRHLRALDAGTGQLRWTGESSIDFTMPIAAAGGVVLAIVVTPAGNLFGTIDAATGHQIATYPFTLAPWKWGTNIAVADGRLYYRTQAGQFIALAAT